MFTKTRHGRRYWFLDTDIDVLGMRMMTLLKAYEKAQDAEGDPIFAKAEQIAHQLHWSDIKKVYKVAKRLEKRVFEEGPKRADVSAISFSKDAQIDGQFNQKIGGDDRHLKGGDRRTHIHLYI